MRVAGHKWLGRRMGAGCGGFDLCKAWLPQFVALNADLF